MLKKCEKLRTFGSKRNIVFKVLHYKFKPEVRMQFKNTITIVHVMAGMCGIHKLYVCYLEHRRWTHVEVIVNSTSGSNTDTV